MPQSRHRKTSKAKKRPKGLYPASKAKSPSGRNRQARIIAIVVVVILAASAIGYLFSTRGSKSGGTEVTTASGLKYTDTVVGTGATPQPGQTLSVHYTGTLQNGNKFDSSLDRGKPMEFKFGLDPMIKGWDEGISTMKVGGKRRLVVPAALGYGAQGRPGIPPNSTLIFDIELLEAK